MDFVMIIKSVLGAVLSYLLGSMPTGFLMGKVLRKIDVRDFGSGNIGATNAFRVLGKGPGTAVLIIDIVKGLIPTVFFPDLLGLQGVIYRILFGLSSIAGHNWTIFLHFKGGKGVATGLGVLLGLTVKVASFRGILAILLAIWFGIFFLSGYVSLSSVIAAVSLPFLMVIFNQSLEFIILGIVFCLFVIVRHRSNINRLFSGQEHRVTLPFFRKSKS